MYSEFYAPMPILRRLSPFLVAAVMVPAASAVPAEAARAQDEARQSRPAITYADVASLADSAPLVVHARLRKLARVEDERATPSGPGLARFYVVAETRALITGASPIGATFAYLVDLPIDARGKPMARKKDEVILFARPVPGRAGELQLVKPSAQIPWSQASEDRVRSILTELFAPDAPARVTGVRELTYVPGTLAGEGETQIFLATADSSAASITVRHQPGQPTQWGASFSELVAELGSPPKPESIEWYRLACALPSNPPGGTNMSDSEEARRMAEADYRMVVASLGPCRRTM
jgi:hypothetical protein